MYQIINDATNTAKTKSSEISVLILKGHKKVHNHCNNYFTIIGIEWEKTLLKIHITKINQATIL